MKLPRAARALPAVLGVQPRTADHVLDDIRQLAAQRDQVEQDIVDHAAARAIVMEEGSLDELVAHDQGAERHRLRLELIDGKHRRLAAEHTAKMTAEEQDRREGLYRAGIAARKRNVQRLADYSRLAGEIGALLRQYRDDERAIDDANATLPEGQARIDIAEPFNGRAARSTEYGPAHNGVPSIVAMAVPASPHVPLLSRVSLPAVEPGAPSHW